MLRDAGLSSPRISSRSQINPKIQKNTKTENALKFLLKLSSNQLRRKNKLIDSISYYHYEKTLKKRVFGYFKKKQKSQNLKNQNLKNQKIESITTSYNKQLRSLELHIKELQLQNT